MILLKVTERLHAWLQSNFLRISILLSFGVRIYIIFPGNSRVLKFIENNSDMNVCYHKQVIELKSSFYNLNIHAIPRRRPTVIKFILKILTSVFAKVNM